MLGTDGSSAENASSSEEVGIDTNVVVDSEWELSEGTRSEGKEIFFFFGLVTEIRMASLGIEGNLGVDGFGNEYQLRSRWYFGGLLKFQQL